MKPSDRIMRPVTLLGVALLVAAAAAGCARDATTAAPTASHIVKSGPNAPISAAPTVTPPPKAPPVTVLSGTRTAVLKGLTGGGVTPDRGARLTMRYVSNSNHMAVEGPMTLAASNGETAKRLTYVQLYRVGDSWHLEIER